jgi:hypothetical protein
MASVHRREAGDGGVRFNGGRADFDTWSRDLNQADLAKTIAGERKARFHARLGRGLGRPTQEIAA